MQKNKLLSQLMILTLLTGLLGCEAITNGDSLFYYGDPAMRPDHISGNSIPVGMKLSLGYDFSCALTVMNVVCWGNNWAGQANAPALSNPTQLSAGAAFACAIDDTGVVCWGDNSFGQTSVPLLNQPTQIRAGANHVCALDSTGVVCWGDNANGQTNVPPLNNPTVISSGGIHSCAIDSTGAVCWGNMNSPSAPALSNPTEISSGWSFDCAIDSTGLVCWGGITYTPYPNASQISVGDNHACFLNSGSPSVVCIGNNSFGQLNTPLLSNPIWVSSGGTHSCAVDDTGIQCWGDNTNGQITVP